MTSDPDPLVTDPNPDVAAALTAINTALDLLETLTVRRHQLGVLDEDFHTAGLSAEDIIAIESGGGDPTFVAVTKYAAVLGETITVT